MEPNIEQLIEEGLRRKPRANKEPPLIEILYEDSAVVALNKPAGITSVPGRVQSQETYYNALKNYFERRESEHFTPRIIHRLDKQTSGLMIIGKHSEAERHVSMQFERHEVFKEYLAVVGGSVAQDEEEIDLPIAASSDDQGRMVADPDCGKEAVTRYRVLDRFRGFSLLFVTPMTGRTHQIRAHLALIGHPVVVDGVYGNGKLLCLSEFKKNYKPRRSRPEKPLISRQALHSYRITFISPETNRPLVVEAPLPHDFALLLRQLYKYGR